ncbi:hypothetical protein [Flavobacterium urumqiense]|uniref:Uncharacterized protein n=1 Tax=Flavobacterium urumqiense TaxID=935224 RepID=A0A1H5Z7J8_9FLAO|nr:hypothetical protein [Flavobacterium urumqiense]SEG31336.1 hypothetical protein SAMN04488130_109102 [Flavobacterium urumqiense]
MKQGKKRTMSICVSDIDKSKIVAHENGKKYLAIETWDNETPDKYDNDFSVAISFNKEEIEKKKAGEEVKRVYLGNGKIWPDTNTTRAITNEEADDLPF